MSRIRFVFGAIILVYVFSLSQSAVELQCISLRNCQKLLNLLKEKPVSQKNIKILRTSQCGFDKDGPKVWCAQIITSSCQTPDGQLGKCTPVKECQSFLQLLKTPNGLSMNTVSYLQKFQCNEPNLNTISVCCREEKSLAIKAPLVITPEPSVISKEPSSPVLPLMIEPFNVTEQPSHRRPSFLPRPTEGECGRQIINKIIGGRVTEMDEFPWTALLEYHLGRRASTSCAGTLISKKYVVTAAHCTDANAIKAVGKLTNVILGEFDTRTARDCINNLGIEDCADPPVKVPVEDIILHPQWYTRPKAQINHDIALLRLATAVRFTDYIKPICLPSPTLTIKEGENLVITGWGRTEYGPASSVKLKTTIPMANRDLCIQKYKNDKHLVVGDGEICVGGEEGKDSCSGDSGGPLMISVDRRMGVWFLVGVVSFGTNQPCGVKDYPALYTYIPRYIDWIYQTVKP